MADHKRFTVATNVKVYFCDQQNPWQRGSNENTNGLLRQYFRKGTGLSISQAKLNAVARWVNERPRKTLNFDTPAERFHLSIASTGSIPLRKQTLYVQLVQHGVDDAAPYPDHESGESPTCVPDALKKTGRTRWSARMNVENSRLRDRTPSSTCPKAAVRSFESLIASRCH